MVSQKRDRSPSTASERSKSSLSDTAIKVGRKAKQAAIKTVKSLTALLKKPRKPRVVSDSDRDVIS
jgi:hypothetical protein